MGTAGTDDVAACEWTEHGAVFSTLAFLHFISMEHADVPGWVSGKGNSITYAYKILHFI